MPKLPSAELARTRAKSTGQKPIKVYHLYPYRGGWTCKSVHYTGIQAAVAAQSVRQAIYLACQHAWINPETDRPVGIVSVYERDQGYRLWCGYLGHQFWEPNHGVGIRALRASIESHQCGDECGRHMAQVWGAADVSRPSQVRKTVRQRAITREQGLSRRPAKPFIGDAS